MNGKKTPLVVVSLVVGALIAGQISGNQPQRDSVALAQQQLGIALESRMVAVGDLELHVVFAGPADGKPVVLLHGYPEFWYAWRGPMAVLAEAGFRVIVPDQRGYNRSEKPANVDAYRLNHLVGDVVGLADALGYEKISLAGHDWGGLVSWWTLILHPDRIEKFAIINKSHPYASKGYEDSGESISWYRTFLQIPWLPGYVGRLGNWRLLVKNLRATSMPGTFPDTEMDQFRSAWDRDGAIHSMGAWYRANVDFDMDVGDAHIAAPTLVIIAPDDAFSPKELVQRSIAFLDDGRVMELDSGTHWVIQDKPELIGESLVEFFSEE